MIYFDLIVYEIFEIGIQFSFNLIEISIKIIIVEIDIIKTSLLKLIEGISHSSFDVFLVNVCVTVDLFNYEQLKS